MTNRHDWMVKKHARSGKLHDFSNLFPHLGPITMHLAIRAKRLCFHKRTPVDLLASITVQLGTFSAEDRSVRTMPLQKAATLLATVFLATVKRNHERNYVLFPLAFGVHAAAICPFGHPIRSRMLLVRFLVRGIPCLHQLVLPCSTE